MVTNSRGLRILYYTILAISPRYMVTIKWTILAYHNIKYP